MDWDSSVVQLEKEVQEILEQSKRTCNIVSPSKQEQEEEEEEEEEDEEDETEDEEDETEDDSDSSVEYEIVSPMRDMTTGGNIVGGIWPYDLTLITSPLMIEYSKQALQVYNDNNNTNFEYDCLVKASSGPVAGVMYYITFEALSGNIRATFHARVWKKVANLGSHVRSCEKLE